MCKRLRAVHCFQNDENKPRLSFYIFELAYILGMSKRNVYRLLKKIGLKLRKTKRRRLAIGTLLGIIATGTFRRYFQRLKKSGRKEITPMKADGYENIPKSRLHLMLKTPEEVIASKEYKINANLLQDAIACGLLPVISVDGEIFVHPEYLVNGGTDHDKSN